MVDDIFADLSKEELDKLTKKSRMTKFLFGDNAKAEDYNRKLEPWEANPKCLRSIKYHHKKGVNRAKDYSNTV